MVEAHLIRVGRAIEMRRKEMGLSRPELARLIPVADKTVERWEKAQTAGADAQLDRIAEVMRTTSAAMLAAAMAEEKEAPATSALAETDAPPWAQTLLDQQTELLSEIGLVRSELEALRSHRGRGGQTGEGSGS